MFIIPLRMKHNLPATSDLIIAVKPITKENRCIDAMQIYYILQNYLHAKAAYCIRYLNILSQPTVNVASVLQGRLARQSCF